MGALLSALVPNLPNDYERAIHSSKELEWLLESLGASGRGLHEKISSIQDRLPAALVKKARYVATIRNRLIHERGFDAIPDRSTFSASFDHCKAELTRLRAAMVSQRESKPAICEVM